MICQTGKRWVKGGASFDEFFFARPVSQSLAKTLGRAPSAVRERVSQ
jgi:hypothetical protein